ncbi:mediator of RNA polymerase II transcription subunit 25 [Episyrphus balteatus]|uniref:mediator of RNA polymerase II transcription subunit 25 n=1 Tax=Episyrphus balteatus TaxID=286459 RepID=UPI002485ACEC|nr:mediator of RNA polymerase II transcription subunit 25 [Episyrphus balteatus]
METEKVADVIFVIEGTAVNGAYINDLKINYIVPALEYFSQSLLDDREYLISDKNSALYGIVVYKTAQCMPDKSVETFGPITSPLKVLETIERLDLTEGQSESNANLSEGIAAARICFDDMKIIRGDNNLNVQRHCILICNSPPYSLPVQDCYPYENKSIEQLATMFVEKKIHLSIVAPRKIPILFKLYSKADNDIPLTSKNYCRDIRHLILLKGFHLKERPISPNINNSVNAQSPMNGMQNPMLVDNQQQIQVQQPTLVSQPFVNTPSAPMQLQYNQNNVQVNRWLFPSQQQRPSFLPGSNSGINVSHNPNSALISQLSTPPNPAVSTMMQHQQALRMQMINQQQTQQQSQIAPSSQQQQPQQNLQQPNNEGVGIRDREKIWSGLLEWIEKTKPDQTKITRQVPCHVTTNIKDGEPEIRAENWPPKLLMQLMPKHLVGNIGGQYLKDSKMVVFRPNPCEALETLSKVMTGGFAGCVHFSTPSSMPSCEIKVLILLYTAEKNAFLGFIPNNQTMFVDRLRKVIQQKQNMGQHGPPAGIQQQQQPTHQTQQQQPHISNITGNSIQAPNTLQQQTVQQQQLQVNQQKSLEVQQMQDQHTQHYNQYAQLSVQQMQEGLGGGQQQQHNMGMVQQQQPRMSVSMSVPPQVSHGMQQQRMVRPMISNNPGLRHLLQQQSTPVNHFRPQLTAINSPNISTAPHIQNRGGQFDDQGFDFM